MQWPPINSSRRGNLTAPAASTAGIREHLRVVDRLLQAELPHHTRKLLEVPPLELKDPLLVGYEAPSQESTTSLSPHQILLPFTQISS